MKQLALFILIISSFLKIQAQDYYFKNYQVEDGLSHNTITSSLQDHRGFLWFGTKDGLDRFDGYTFKVFRYKPGEEFGLGSNFIRTLHEYRNNIWVGTDNGLYKYNEELEQFHLIKSSANKPILDIENDDQGNLWFIAGGITYKLNLETSEITNFNDHYAWWVVRDQSGKIWMTTQDRFYSYSPDSNSFSEESLNFDLSKTYPFIITKIQPTDQGKLLIGTKYQGAFWYDLKTNDSRSVLPENQDPLYVRDFAFRNKEELWIATESGVFIYNTKTEQFQNLKKSYNNPYALSDNAIYSIMVDQEGGTWIGTYFGGINYYPKPYTPFKKYFPKVGENSISGNAVREIHEDQNGKLWIGTEDAGLNRFDPKTGKFFNIPQQNLSHYNIHGMLPLDGELWVGTFEHGLDVLDINSGKRIRHYEADGTPGSLQSDFVLDIFKASNDKLYISTSLGVYEYDSKKDNFEIVKGFPLEHHYSYMAEDVDGTLWAGSYWDGLFYFNPKTGENGVYKHENNDPESISSNVINGIYLDSRNNLWITTENGLNLYDRKNDNFKKFTSNEGLPTNVIYSILEDDKGDLWVSTSNGIARMNGETKEVKTYNMANGLLSDQFNYSSAYKAADGTMYFGSVDGMISFNPENFTTNDNNSPVLFTDLQINNKDVTVNGEDSPLKESINFQDKITLHHDQSSFSLEFTNLSYSSAEMTEYWYKMDGLQNDWVHLGREHRIFFTELPPGDYILQVKSKNGYGSFSKQNAKLSIEVLPPFWLSPWANAIYTILVLLIIYFSVRYYHQYLKEKNQQRFAIFQNQKEKEIYQAKIQFFTNVAHEIRTPLTLIKAPLEKMKTLMNTQKTEFGENVAIMEKNTTRLLNLVNELLDFRKTESHTLKLSFIKTDIKRLVKETYLRFKPMIEEKQIDFNLSMPEEPVVAFVDQEGIKKILSNLFNNALKYSEKRVLIQLTADEQNWELSVENDGPLIPESYSEKIFEPFFRVSENDGFGGTGIGLSLAHSLASLHNGKLSLEKSDPALNTFLLKVPIHQQEEFYLYEPQVLENDEIEPVSSLEPEEKPNVLIVEDNKDLLEFLNRELKDFYHIFKADNGQKALEIIQNENIQLVLSDVSMPGTDGYTLCKTIKNDLSSSHIPVILLTAKSALDSKITGLESGADSYITKPFSIEFVKAQVNSLIQNRKNIMEYFASTPLSHIKSIANSKTDVSFLSKLDEVIYSHLADTDLSVETLADVMNMSRSSLYRKIKDLSNLTPNELINVARLKKAAELLNSGEYKIYEVSEKVGYKSQTSFGRNFQKQFKMTPSEYMNSTKV